MPSDNFKINLVTRNDVLKTLTVTEEKVRNEWFSKWGYLLDFNKLCVEQAEKRGISAEDYKIMITKKKPKSRFEKYIWLPQPSPAYPKTSSGIVGWRSAPEFSLEKMGPLYVSPKQTLPCEEPLLCVSLG